MFSGGAMHLCRIRKASSSAWLTAKRPVSETIYPNLSHCHLYGLNNSTGQRAQKVIATKAATENGKPP